MDESQAASQQIIQYLPIMFGFFALNVPSGLGVYWVTNTLFSTAATVLIKQQVQAEMAASGLSVPQAPVPASSPAGGSSSPTSFSDMIDATPKVSADSTFTPMDAEVVMDPEGTDGPALRPVEGFASSLDTDGPPATSKQKKSKKKKGKRGKK